MKLIARIFFPIVILCSCNAASDSSEEKEAMSEKGDAIPVSNTSRQLNINILWDLSDRIDPVTNPASPQHHERDIEIIKTITSFFKKDMEKRGAYKAKGRIKVFFTPPPENARINTIAANLTCDLSSYMGDGANKKKKEMYDSIESRFSRSANEIYQLTVANNKNKKQWDGSDIWRFFKNDVKDYCIDPSGNYRNILVILTDGYIFHKDSREKQGNRTAYILPEILKPFRNNSGWQNTFLKGDYGLISTRKDLQNLEVLVLEITPSKEYKNDEDILKAYLGKWFEEMGIPKSDYACYNTDLPEYTRKKIESFLNR
ncbi:MAG TPA: hypothetical protein VF476_05480 [Chitinophagaceae bacterium]